MRKKYLLIIPFVILALASCRRSTEGITSVETTTIVSNGDTVIKKELYFDNQSKLYKSSSKEYLSTYFFNNSDIPYVSIEDYINIVPYFDQKLQKNEDNTYVLDNSLNPKKLKVDEEKDQIIMYDFGFYNIDEKQIKNDNSYYDSLDFTFFETNEDIETILDLSKYNLTIEEVDDKIVLPFHVVSNLFGTDSYIYTYYSPTKYVGYALEEGASSYSFDPLPTSNEYLEYNYNIVNFIFGELYGVGEYYKFNINNMLSKYKSRFLNTDTSFSALGDFVTSLEDCHVGFYSFSDGYNGYPSFSTSDRESHLYETYSTIEELRNVNQTYTLNSETAVIQLDEFNIEGTFSPITIRDKLNDYKNKGYKNIIFDIGLNGGGDTFALAYILGLMTNDDIVFNMTNIKNGHQSGEIFKIDINGDGSFTDNDAYDNFNYYVLASEFSYSCANEFVHYVKQNKLATVIGQQTGGGACAISPLATPSGALLQYSGLLAFIYEDNFFTEYGVEPDYLLSYEKMYNDESLLEFIESIN